MNSRIRLLAVFSVFLAFNGLGALSVNAAPAVSAPGPIPVEMFRKKPKLVVVMVVDQFRADYLTRFESRFLPAQGKDGSPGGYRYLMSKGAYFPFAEYDALQCMTGPGHAMILSGSYPYLTGVPLNGWYDEKSRKPMYCSEDSSEAIVGVPAGAGKTPLLGMSPRNFHANTVGDELKNAGYPSKVVALALKDRAAVFMGGHRADLSLWFEPSAYRWVSSRFYLPEGKLPKWVEKLNQEIENRKGSPLVFEGNPKAATGFAELNPSFKHSTTVGSKESLAYPWGLELTANAAERVLENMKLGQGPTTDLLAVSFSSHDYMAHHYGPNAAELEEMTVVEDRVIAGFLKKLQKKVPGGLKDVVLVLTADHGGPPLGKWAKEKRLPAGHISARDVSQRINERLNEKFGRPKAGDWLAFSTDLNFFFSPDSLLEKEVSREAVEKEAKIEAQKTEGSLFVFTRSDYEQRRLPPEMFSRQILRTYIPGRSGDLVMIPKPFVMEGDTGDYLVNHMTSYSYDRTVPLIIAGPKVRTGVYATRAEVVDLAPTLSFMLGVLPPSTSEGRVLSEILGGRE